MDVHRPALHDVKTLCRIALVKQVGILVERLHHGNRGDVFQIGGWQPSEKLTTPQCVDDDNGFEFVESGSHEVSIQSVSCQK